MSVICVIPARYQSTRFPGKLLVKAQGKTVLQRTYECALRCPDLDRLYVATDDERIGEHVAQFGGEVLWTSSKPRDGTQRIIEALSLHEKLQKADAILNLQGDHPCTSPSTMSAVVQALLSDPEAAVSTAAVPIRDPRDFLAPQSVKCVFNKSGSALYFSRAPIPYNNAQNGFLHIGIYCYRRFFLEKLGSLPPTPLQECEDLEQLKILEWGYPIKIALVEEKTPSVDVPEDLDKLEEYLCNQKP